MIYTEKCQEKGHSSAQHCPGILYESCEGVEMDFITSFYWFDKATENGNKIMQYNLGEFYELTRNIY